MTPNRLYESVLINARDDESIFRVYQQDILTLVQKTGFLSVALGHCAFDSNCCTKSNLKVEATLLSGDSQHFVVPSIFLLHFQVEYLVSPELIDAEWPVWILSNASKAVMWRIQKEESP